ncbi:hypothetical protein [Yinghuangia seranimata]|uniref:hypothetical protein n=1 Tax=Yinghuangia seranimata TaxID=408067 RepID=UPI00248AD337|nr:hypothetical protein [Yinghuangia seranimata]MDI2130276.1 hypothetical protein [Yinghuangia seranimata]
MGSASASRPVGAVAWDDAEVRRIVETPQRLMLRKRFILWGAIGAAFVVLAAVLAEPRYLIGEVLVVAGAWMFIGAENRPYARMRRVLRHYPFEEVAIRMDREPRPYTSRRMVLLDGQGQDAGSLFTRVPVSALEPDGPDPSTEPRTVLFAGDGRFAGVAMLPGGSAMTLYERSGERPRLGTSEADRLAKAAGLR